jgi:hypothetical protein
VRPVSAAGPSGPVREARCAGGLLGLLPALPAGPSIGPRPQRIELRLQMTPSTSVDGPRRSGGTTETAAGINRVSPSWGHPSRRRTRIGNGLMLMAADGSRAALPPTFGVRDVDRPDPWGARKRRARRQCSAGRSVLREPRDHRGQGAHACEDHDHHRHCHQGTQVQHAATVGPLARAKEVRGALEISRPHARHAAHPTYPHRTAGARPPRDCNTCRTKQRALPLTPGPPWEP